LTELQPALQVNGDREFSHKHIFILLNNLPDKTTLVGYSTHNLN